MEEYQRKMISADTTSEVRRRIDGEHILPLEEYNPDGLDSLDT